VVPPSKQEAVKAHDASVERAVRKALAGRPELSDASIDVDVENGVARLTGTVPTEEQRLTAGLAARSVTGLKFGPRRPARQPPALAADPRAWLVRLGGEQARVIRAHRRHP